MLEKTILNRLKFVKIDELLVNVMDEDQLVYRLRGCKPGDEIVFWEASQLTNGEWIFVFTNPSLWESFYRLMRMDDFKFSVFGNR